MALVSLNALLSQGSRSFWLAATIATLTVALPWEQEFLSVNTMHIYSPGKMVSLDGILNLSVTWFEELLPCCSGELEPGDAKELAEEERASI